MNTSEVKVVFPMSKVIFDLVVKEASSEECPVVLEKSKKEFIVLYVSNDSYCAMTSRISGPIKDLIREAFTEFSKDLGIYDIVKKYLTPTTEAEDDVVAVLYNTLGTAVCFSIPGNTTLH